jgi:hypothetical protein
MSADPRWLPHPSGKFRRGLEVDHGTLTWAALNQGDTRTKSIFINRKDLTLATSDAKVVTAEYGKPVSSYGPHVVHVASPGVGKATLTALAPDGRTATLEVESLRATGVLVRFFAVESDSWKSKLSAAKIDRLMKNLNYIYSYQGNFVFKLAGPMQTLKIAGLPAVVDVNDIMKWGQYRDCGADATVFFVPENSVLGANWRDLIIMEDSQKIPFDEMTLAHEMGHRFGLDHPDPPLPVNLMNQTAVGDRHRMKIFLTRAQIESITVKSNWNQLTFWDEAACVVESLLN